MFSVYTRGVAWSHCPPECPRASADRHDCGHPPGHSDLHLAHHLVSHRDDPTERHPTANTTRQSPGRTPRPSYVQSAVHTYDTEEAHRPLRRSPPHRTNASVPSPNTFPSMRIGSANYRNQIPIPPCIIHGGLWESRSIRFGMNRAVRVCPDAACARRDTTRVRELLAKFRKPQRGTQ